MPPAVPALVVLFGVVLLSWLLALPMSEGVRLLVTETVRGA